MGLVGLGPSSEGDHAPGETVDLASLDRQRWLHARTSGGLTVLDNDRAANKLDGAFSPAHI